MTARFVVIYESAADFATASEIADRALVAEIQWLDETLLDSQRCWMCDDGCGNDLTWKSIPARARELGIAARGHFSGEPGLPDAQAARRAIRFVRRAVENANAIILVRDVDNQPERLRGLEQARSEAAKSITVAIGAANPKRESWVVCGFDPEGDDEYARLAGERQVLGFDPRIASQQLTATGDHDKRSAKRVLTSLTGGNRERERKCWLGTPLAVFDERGKENGLADFVREVRTLLAPLICE